MTSNGLIRLQVKWRGFGHNFNEFIGAAANHDNNVVATYMRKNGLNPTAAATIGQASSKGATKPHRFNSPHMWTEEEETALMCASTQQKRKLSGGALHEKLVRMMKNLYPETNWKFGSIRNKYISLTTKHIDRIEQQHLDENQLAADTAGRPGRSDKRRRISPTTPSQQTLELQRVLDAQAQTLKNAETALAQQKQYYENKQENLQRQLEHHQQQQQTNGSGT